MRKYTNVRYAVLARDARRTRVNNNIENANKRRRSFIMHDVHAIVFGIP